MNTPCSDRSKSPLSREEILALPNPKKFEYFQGIRRRHPRINEVLEDLDLLTRPGSGTQIVLLIGPTGVGKSTLIHGLYDQVLREHADELREDPSFIPMVTTEAPSSGERGFSWKLFYSQIAERMNEPLIHKKQETALMDGRVVFRPVAVSSVTGLRQVLENVLKARRTRILVIDEAVHLLRNLQGNSLANHMDCLKSLANTCGSTLVLVGSYDLLQMMDLNGQVARRTAIVHFSRYATTTPEDLEVDSRDIDNLHAGVNSRIKDGEAFAKILGKLVESMPIEGVRIPPNRIPELQTACVGCVGILKDTLSRALGYALRNGEKWSLACLEKSLLTPLQSRAIMNETLFGEKKIQRALLGSGSFSACTKAFQKAESGARALELE